MVLDPDRRVALDDARAVALVRRGFGVEVEDRAALPGGFGMVADGRRFVHLLDAGPRAFGAAEIWCRRDPAAPIAFLVDAAADPGAVARRAQALTPPVEVWAVAGDELTEATADDLPAADPIPDAMQDLAGRVRGLGLEVVVDHGEVVIECVGLEVGRLVLDGGIADLEAGVGSFDREANRVLHRGDTAWDVLVRVADEVRERRRPGALDHPIGRMAREAWLAHSLRSEDPGLRRLMPTVARTGIRQSGPVALRRDEGGQPSVTLCTVGADVALVGVAADLVVRESVDRLEIVVPAGGVHRAVHDLQGRLLAHCAIRETAPPWDPR